MFRAPLPPLNALRAFEATARHLSVRAAAEELHVTSPAVSHQLKALEDYLGFAVFVRLRRGIRLTEKGAAYFHRVSRALESVSNATQEIRHSGAPRTLRLAVPPHLLSGWLLARLPKLATVDPVTTLHIVDTVRRVDFESEGVDAQILWGTGTWSGLSLDLLIEDELCIVCSPRFLAEFGPLTGLQDLAECPLIHTDRRPITWERVLGAARVRRSPRARDLVLLRPLPVVQAVLCGLGVAIISRICVADLISSGKVVVPFEHQFQLSPRIAYFLAQPANGTARERNADLLHWLRLELSRTIALK